MDKIDIFFNKMKSLFLEKDIDEFEELKEDMLEHIYIELDQGKDIDDILAKLGTPKTIVDAFYEDKRLNKVLQYETDIVAIEEIQSVVLQEKKDKVYKRANFFKNFFFVLIKVIFVLLIIFSFIVLVWNLVKFHHFNTIVFLILGNSLFGLVLIKDLRTRSMKKISLYSFVFIITTFFIMYSIHYRLFFYEGEFVDETIELNHQTLESLTIKSDYPVNLTIEQTEQEFPMMKVKGRVTDKSKKQLKKIQNSDETMLDFGRKSIVSLFMSMGELDIFLSLPKETEKNLTLDFENADIQGREIFVRHFDISVETGNVTLVGVESQHFRFKSSKADILVNDFNTPIEISNSHGKSIVKNGMGNISVTTDSGLTSLFNINGDRARINKNDGKLIITDTELDDIEVKSKNNTMVIENQNGLIKLDTEKGKIILRENQGSVQINNEEAPIMITQHIPIEGNIESNIGLVKWVQYVNEDSEIPFFELKSKNKNIRNDFINSNFKKSNKKVNIQTNTGEIEVIKN